MLRGVSSINEIASFRNCEAIDISRNYYGDQMLMGLL